MAELRQQTQPAQKPQQVPTPAKMGNKASEKSRKLSAPALARETPSEESDQQMMKSKCALVHGTIKKAMTFVSKVDSYTDQSDEGMGHIGKKKYNKTWSPLKGTKWSEERRALRGGKKWRSEHPEGQVI